MHTFLNLAFYFILQTLFCIASPIPKDGLSSFLFYKEYTQFQISDGQGGHALEEAKLVFEEPFHDVPLVNIPYSIYERLLNMWEAVEYASLETYPDAFGQRDEPALRVGKTKNDVLMKMVQIFRIKIAKDGNEGTDTEESEEILTELEDRLMAAVEEDRQNSGRASQRVELYYPL